ncbi:glycosyltransferase family 2 protein [Dechloromonas hortensis]|uniref:glycosyltransferase family 2 protein n=1 Tax=Dechloromonas hortensis TaxID=337779 RepID=UPI0012918D33|nr:glycosyltransferase family 2 protein [Dechloromonas hortensis]
MISVVIPLYNKAAHIADAIKSVLAQSVAPQEIIVVDDGSTDNGVTIVSQFNDAGVRLLRQPNLGVSAARNLGLQEATSRYVAFLDADDYWLPDHLKTLYGLIERWPQASLVSTSHYIKRGGKLYAAKSSLPAGWEGGIENFFEIYANGLSLVNSSTACVNRQRLIDEGGFPVGVKRGEDIVAWTRLALGNVVAHKAIPTSVYNQEAENRSTMLREQEPPGSLLYLAKLLRSHELKAHVGNSIAVLFDRIALVTAAGFYLSGDVVGAKKIAKLMRDSGRVKSSIAIRLVILLPLSVLRLAKQLRHRRVT